MEGNKIRAVKGENRAFADSWWWFVEELGVV